MGDGDGTARYSNETTLGILKEKVRSIESRLDRMDRVEVPIEILPDGTEPYHANETDAGYDVFATETVAIAPGRTVVMPVGIRVAVPEGYEMQVRPRSGISSKVSLRVANSPGTIDSGYRDEVGVILNNLQGPSDTRPGHVSRGPIDICGNPYVPDDGEDIPNGSIVVRRGDRIAQLVLSKVIKADFVRSGDVSSIGRDRRGGFGSTGTSLTESFLSAFRG